jgi:endoglucanase
MKLLLLSFLLYLRAQGFAQPDGLILNKEGYFEMPGLNVMVFHDYYPEGHQGGVTIVQNGVRVAANGDLRLEPAPGQWQPIPKVGNRTVDKDSQTVTVSCSYPNPDRDRKGFNPIIYPALQLSYKVKVKAEGASFRIIVDLEKELPPEWVGKVGFNLELFPGDLFGKAYYMDQKSGIFPRQLSGLMIREQENRYEVEPLAEGQNLVIAPECDSQRMRIHSLKGELQLLDGRAHHNNGWFIVRSPVPKGATTCALEWLVSPSVLPDWKYKPVIHISQVGYHPGQKKVAVIECDLRHKSQQRAVLQRIMSSGKLEAVLSNVPEHWGKFLRYQYLRFDFSAIQEKGMYVITYGDSKTQPFKIDSDVFDRNVWQPTLEYFLPVQMCHVRVNDRYRVWHGACHLDDALMAPVDTLHLDGYSQGDSTLTSFKPLQHVPGLDLGGWHDAGDYDLRVESQAGTVRILSLIYESFKIDYDETTVDEGNRLVELHLPDGKPDILQQIEHGVLTILGGYKNLGRLYRGIICPTLRQYVLLGDGSTMTDNRIYSPDLDNGHGVQNESRPMDDRWVFTEINPRRELFVAGCLAAVFRALKDYNASLAQECLQVAVELWEKNQASDGHLTSRVEALVELALATDDSTYKNQLVAMWPDVSGQMGRIGWLVARVQPLIKNDSFKQSAKEAVRSYYNNLEKETKENPFGVPYRPQIWGAGWEIEEFGVQQYFLHKAWPDIVPKEPALDALNFILGCHPGPNTASFASGVGANSVTVAYGFNRADWSYIPGGVVSGTAYIRPDFPELKEWPFLWQQTEYVIGGGAANFMFLVLAARQLLEDEQVP